MSDGLKDDALPKISGHVLIRDPNSKEVLLDRRDTIDRRKTISANIKEDNIPPKPSVVNGNVR